MSGLSQLFIKIFSFKSMNHFNVFFLAGIEVAAFDEVQARRKIFLPNVFINFFGVGKTIDSVDDGGCNGVIFGD